MGTAYGEGQIIRMARERGEGNACWHLASKSRAFPSCSWTSYVGLSEKADLGEKKQIRSTAAYQTENTSFQ